MAVFEQSFPGTGYGNSYVNSLVDGGRWVSGAVGYFFVSESGQTWSSPEQAAFQRALADFSAVANISFEQKSTYADANMVWWEKSTASWTAAGLPTSTLAFHEGPDGVNLVNDPYRAEGWFHVGNPGWTDSNFGRGSLAYWLILHELGHGIGLAHPHNADEPFPGVTVNDAADAGDHSLNQHIWTMMSYRLGWSGAPTPSAASNYGNVATPMAFDVAALQAIYGANMSTRTGNDLYTLQTSNTANNAYWSCIWDAGGTDTISNQGSSLAATIDLRAAPLTGENAAGYVSRAAGVVGGFTIANGAVIENATGGNGADTIYGNDAGNFIIGWDGNDSIQGHGGNDNLNGYGDNDTVNGDGGNDTLYGSGGNDTLYGGGYGADENDQLYGETGDDLLVGSGGNDTLDGGDGIDRLHGGAGDDTYHMRSGDTFASNAESGQGQDAEINGTGGGVDLVVSYVSSHTLGSSFENLRLVFGSGAVAGYGNALANNMTGNEGNNHLYGNVGNDTLLGADGQDSLYGAEDNDTLEGGNGNDTLVGGSGLDEFRGGADNDTYYVDGASENIFESFGGGTDLVYVDAAFFELDANVENLTVYSSEAISRELRGNELANVITGASGNDTIRSGDGADSVTGGFGNDLFYGFWGNDTLLGGAGSDTFYGEVGLDSMVGGEGNDIYFVDQAGEWTVEIAGLNQGTDRVYTTLTSYALQAEVEQLFLRGAARNGTGNDGRNFIEGNARNNNLSGLGEGDLLEGLAGSDTLDGGAGLDRLFGGDGGDSLTGGADNDVLWGGTGNDTLNGGAGRDAFVFDAALGTSAVPNLDAIDAFSTADDTIQLSRTIFSGISGSLSNGLGGLAVGQFAYKTTSGIQASDDRVVYDRSTGQLWYDGTGGAMTDAVQFAVLDPNLALGRADFVVIA